MYEKFMNFESNGFLPKNIYVRSLNNKSFFWLPYDDKN